MTVTHEGEQEGLVHPNESKPIIGLGSNDTELTDMARQSAIGGIVDASLRFSGKTAPIAADDGSRAVLFSGIVDWTSASHYVQKGVCRSGSGMSSHRYNWLLPEANLEALLSL